MSRSKNFSVYENLDTSFVNLGALLRYLQQRDFTGRIHIMMSDYEAIIILRDGERREVRERDIVTGREAEGEAALQRLLIRALDAGGRISVYSEEEQPRQLQAGIEESGMRFQAMKDEVETEGASRVLSDQEIDWRGLLRTSAELIASVERAAQSCGANFEALFRLSRLELADDYDFLDPNVGSFEYSNSEIELHASPGERPYVSGLCETLRRVVEKIATGKRAASVRERVALELAVLVRRRQRQLTEFGIMSQLDRIAGTRVI
jgi:hypothetical protein